MSRLAKIIWGIVATVIMLVVGYYVFKTDRVFDLVLPKNESGAKVREFLVGVRDAVYKKIDPLITPVTDSGKAVVGDAVDVVKSQVDSIFQKAKDDAVQSIKKSVNEKIDSLAGKPVTQNISSNPVIASSISASLNEIFSLGFSVKKGLPGIFVIKNNDKSGEALDYSIDWGDGKKDTGVLPVSDAKTIFHIWTETGEYNINVTLGSGESKRSQLSYIIVY